MNYQANHDFFQQWRDEGSQLIPQNYQRFRALAEQAKDYLRQGEYEMAAIYVEMAAFYATSQHCGLFFSPELEQILTSIGKNVIKSDHAIVKSQSSSKEIKNIVHVATSVGEIGGLSRMLVRWIRQDADHTHSVVLIRQMPIRVPQALGLKEAVQARHGKIHILNQGVGGLLSWARRLREIAAEADLIVLHMSTHEVVPIIAFADQEQSPPILLMNHADHAFWIGASISNVVVSDRKSGVDLAHRRRGIGSNHNMLLPVPLELAQRVLSRQEAKRQLGIPETDILLLSVARSLKYKTIDNDSFADAHLPLLMKYKQAHLMVVGAGDREDWSAAIEQTNGRIKLFDETPNTAVFLQAADIYVDSFPFPSITSLMEAGSYNVPLVSRYPFPNGCEVLGADSPGLDSHLIRVQNLQQYTDVLSKLIEDEEFRSSVGEETKCEIAKYHTKNGWQSFLKEAYVRSTNTPRITILETSTDQMLLVEPDVYLQRIHGPNHVDETLQLYLRAMPFKHRLYHWLNLFSGNGWHNTRFSLLLPNWIHFYYRQMLKD